MVYMCFITCSKERPVLSEKGHDDIVHYFLSAKAKPDTADVVRFQQKFIIFII